MQRLAISMALIGALLGFYLPLSAGFVYGMLHKDQALSKSLSKLLLYFFIPLLLYDSLSRRHVSFSFNEYWFMSILAFYITISSLLVAYPLFKSKKGLIMVSSYTNGGFFPVPIALSLWGENAISLIGFFILGQVIISNILIPFLSSTDFKNGFKKLLLFPPIYAMLIGLFSSSFNVYPPSDILNIVSELGRVSSILALIVLGLDASKLRTVKFDDLKVALIRHIYSPVVVYLFMISLGIRNLPFLVSMLESMMPPAVSNIIYANEFDMDTELVANAVLTSTIIATIFVPPLFFIIS